MFRTLHKLSTTKEVGITLFVCYKIRKFVFPNEIRSRFMQIETSRNKQLNGSLQNKPISLINIPLKIFFVGNRFLLLT